MSTTGHIDDQVAARAVGALTPDEQQQVDEHCRGCPRCQKLLQAAEESANLLVLAVSAVQPPRHCKARLMQRIEDARFVHAPTRTRSRLSAWSGWAVAGAVLLVMLTWNMQLRGQLIYATMVGTMLVSDPQSRILTPQDREHQGVVARMYMLPSSTYALLVIDNVQPAPKGKVYRVWVANEKVKRSVTAFNVADKRKPMVLEPPEPLTSYKWIMITMEDADESASPEETTILRGDL